MDIGLLLFKYFPQTSAAFFRDCRSVEVRGGRGRREIRRNESERTGGKKGSEGEGEKERGGGHTLKRV